MRLTCVECAMVRHISTFLGILGGIDTQCCSVECLEKWVSDLELEGDSVQGREGREVWMRSGKSMYHWVLSGVLR